MVKAIMTQQTATYGLFLSPILAHFQNMPRNPVLFLSSRLGANERIYAHVQMSNRMTVRRLWKLKMADISSLHHQTATSHFLCYPGSDVGSILNQLQKPGRLPFPLLWLRMVMEVSLRQITVASQPEHTFFLKVEWKEDFGAGFVILLCDGSSAWSGEVSEEEVSREAQEMEMVRERYVDDLQVALTGNGLAVHDYAFHLTAEQGRGRGSAGGLHLSYEKVQKDISFRLGAVELQPVPEPAAVVRELITHGLEHSGRLHSTNQKLQQENEKLRQEQQRLTADMERYVNGKETLEQELYSRFVLVLNAKKAKIRELQARVKQLEESLEEERERRKAVNAECSKNAKSRSPGSSPVREESDYGASTEEDEEKEEQPSTSAIKTSTRDAFSCSPILDDSPSDITDIAPSRKRRQRHLQQLEAQAKRQALEESHRSRNEQTHAKLEAQMEAAHRPAQTPKAFPEPEDLFDDF